jgi:aryl sulfotransferase
MPKCGNFWLYRTIQELLKASGVDHRSFIRQHPIHPEAQQWRLSYEGQADIDAIAVEGDACFAVISTAFRERIEDLDAYLGQCTHVWTHAPWSSAIASVASRCDTVVYILRDPRDMAISMSKFAFTSYYQEHFQDSEPDASAFLKHRLYGQILSWVRHVAGYLVNRDTYNVKFVFYERMLHDLTGEVGELAEYLGTSLSGDRLATVVDRLGFRSMKEQNPSHVRKGTAGQWATVLSAAQKRQVAKMAGPMLRLLNYPVDESDLNDGIPELPAVVERADVERAVRVSRGDLLDKIKYGLSLGVSKRPLREKVRKGLQFLSGSARV